MGEENSQLKEIDLSELLKIINKGKRIVISLFFIGLALGTIWFFASPFTYSGTAILQIGKVSAVDGSRYYIEEPFEATEKIKEGIYGNLPGRKVDNPEKTSLVRIKYSGDSYEEVKDRLNSLVSAVLERHDAIFNAQNGRLEERAGLLRAGLADINNEVSLLLARGGQQIEYLKTEAYRTELLINSVENQIAASMPTKVLMEPVVSEVKNVSYLTIIMGGLLGLFLGVVFVFLKEWLGRNNGII